MLGTSDLQAKESERRRTSTAVGEHNGGSSETPKWSTPSPSQTPKPDREICELERCSFFENFEKNENSDEIQRWWAEFCKNKDV